MEERECIEKLGVAPKDLVNFRALGGEIGG